MHKKKVELLAPAGNKEAFYGAIHAGADAVYLAGSRFGARAYADNFTEDDLISCIRYAHIYGRKVYLTVNTLVKETEFHELYDYLCPFYSAGLDGIIIQDFGVLSYVKAQFPQMELHVSTQMTITGKHGAELLQEMGACRIVPSRELSLAEIKEMKNATGIEIEAFIHGAMCYCYSGQCLFSSIIGGRSGNRGRCAQPCRLPYSAHSREHSSAECYPLSLKDMCTIEQIPELIESGIDSFKIEGRMKKPEYAAGVTAIYRKYIDLYYRENNGNFQVSKEDIAKLSRLYIRSELQNGYYHKHNGKDMITLNSPAYSGSDEALLKEIHNKYLEKSPKISVDIYGTFKVGEPACIIFIAEGLTFIAEGDVVQPASKQPISGENIKKQLSKLGNSVFHANSMEISLDEGAFYSLKALNDLRRNAVEGLENMLIDAHGLVTNRDIPNRIGVLSSSSKEQKTSGLHISVRTSEQLTAILRSPYAKRISRIYIYGDLLLEQSESKLTEILDKNMEIIISMPNILRMRDEEYLNKLYHIACKHPDIFSGFLVGSAEAMGYLKKKCYIGKIYTDAGFYMWNHYAVKTWGQNIAGFCIPYELKSAEQKALLDGRIPCEKIFYGRIPMMITANCVAKTTYKCQKDSDESEMILLDRYQKRFPVVLNCNHCMNIIYNSLPLSLHKEWKKWNGLVDMRINFTVEKGSEILEVFDFFCKLYQGEDGSENTEPPYKEYTTGHEKRGVE